ncbi:hypothetical protein PRNP1_011698 [Phytophthora ramorum]
MATSAYESWLKKREFKVPRSSASPPAKIPGESGASASKTTAESDDEPPQQKRHLASAYSGKFHAVSAVEATQVAVKSVSRPSAVGKRPRSWLTSQEKAARREEESKVAGTVIVAEQDAAEVAGRKRVRVGQDELLKATVLKLTSVSTVLKLSSAKRDKERSIWSARVESEAKVAAKVALPEVTKAKELLVQEKRAPRKRAIYETESGDSTTKQLRFDVDEEESENSGPAVGLPPKSPERKKQRKMRTAMLDESQYWMAVDRFSHLT